MTDFEAVIDDAGEQEAAILAEARLAVRPDAEPSLDDVIREGSAAGRVNRGREGRETPK